MKIVLAQFWTPNVSYSKFTHEINNKYCGIQNYIYHVETDEIKIKSKIQSKAFTWYKPHLILDVLDIYNPDYVLFLDADAIVVDFENKIENFIKNDKDIIVTEDYGPSAMNAGVILLKNTDWVKNFLKQWFNLSDELEGGNPPTKGFYANALWHDQTCFSHLFNTYEDVRLHVEIIDNKVLNGRYFRDVVNKNFIFHAFSYGYVPNRTIDNAYHELFHIPKPEKENILDMIDYYATDKHFGHNYFNLIYNDIFKEIRTECKKFMEIGIFDGESIRLWRDYFINAQIIGIEYNLPDSLNKLGDTPKDRMILLNLDQSKESDLEEICGRFNDLDVIMDDGSHIMKDQQLSLGKLFKSLKPGGIYILEDLHTSLIVSGEVEFSSSFGEKDKTTTLDVLENYIKNKNIYSDFMSEEDMKYLNDNIESVEIYRNQPQWSITSIIRKKN